MGFSMVNEFDQKLFVFQLVRFRAHYTQQKNIMKAALQLEDFEIEDRWSLSKMWPRLIEAKEEYDFTRTEDSANLQEFDETFEFRTKLFKQ